MVLELQGSCTHEVLEVFPLLAVFDATLAPGCVWMVLARQRVIEERPR